MVRLRLPSLAPSTVIACLFASAMARAEQADAVIAIAAPVAMYYLAIAKWQF